MSFDNLPEKSTLGKGRNKVAQNKKHKSVPSHTAHIPTASGWDGGGQQQRSLKAGFTVNEDAL